MPIVNWISQFLDNYKNNQYDSVTGSKSSIAVVSNVIIQGDVLGPTHFVLYVNDIPSIFYACRVKLRADNVKVYMVIESSNDKILLQNALNALLV